MDLVEIELYTSWKEYKLGELIETGKANLQTGPFGTMLKASEYSNTGVPVIAVQDIGDNKLVYHKFVYVDNETADRLNRYKVKEGDIIFGRKGATDRRALIKKNEEGWLQGSDCIRLRLDNSINSNFISYQLGSLKDWMSQFSIGATMPSLNQEILKLLPLKIPPYQEQLSITSILLSIDDKIDLLHRQNKTLEELAETLFRKWFVVEADESWEIGRISNIVNVLSGFAFKSSEFRIEGKYRLVTIKSVQDGYMDLSKTDFLNDVPVRMPNYCFLDEGDVLLSLTGNVGRCCIVSEKNLLLNQRVAKLLHKQKENWAYAYTMFRQQSMKRALEDLAKGTAQANLSPVELGNMEVQIPPKDILSKFSVAATPLLEKVLANKKQIKIITQLRDTLLTKLMSGEARIKGAQNNLALS